MKLSRKRKNLTKFMQAMNKMIAERNLSHFLSKKRNLFISWMTTLNMIKLTLTSLKSIFMTNWSLKKKNPRLSQRKMTTALKIVKIR